MRAGGPGICRWVSVAIVRSARTCLKACRGGVGALCFVLGAFLALPTVAGAPAQFAGTTEWVLLTISKKIARQALRMEADRQKLKALRAEAGSYALRGVSSHSSSGRRSCGGVRRQRTRSRRSRTWTRA